VKALILAAGYATRLYPLTINQAKPLLPIAGKAAIEYIIEAIEQITEIDEILVATNKKFFKQFNDWRQKLAVSKPLKILNDKTVSERDRLGAIGDINFVLKEEKIEDDLLVIAGDNLFERGLREFVNFAKVKTAACSVALHKLDDKEAVKRYSQVRLDAEGRIIEFIEKPPRPTSTLVAKCVYFFSKSRLGLIAEYINSGRSTDAPGHYIAWLCQRDAVYGFVFAGRWYDIGNYETYRKADNDFRSLQKGER
jgi:glucose-1-phosphate thymidylyltransferase